jgi:seryl-tRNA synthetase
MDSSLQKIQLLISSLKEKKDKLKTQIEELELELKEIDGSLSAINTTLALLEQERPITSADASNKYAEMTKKDAILDVLSSHPEKQWKANEVTNLLKINGIKSKSKSLQRDVYNELYRLEKSGKIETIKKRGKRKGTKYQIKREGTPSSAEEIKQ